MNFLTHQIFILPDGSLTSNRLKHNGYDMYHYNLPFNKLYYFILIKFFQAFLKIMSYYSSKRFGLCCKVVFFFLRASLWIFTLFR